MVTDPEQATAAEVSRLLTAAEFHRLSDVSPEVEWFANLSNHHTRRVYENAVKDFTLFTGIVRPEEFRTVTRAHIIAWRDQLAGRELGGATIRHRLASLASLFEYLCEKNAVTHNPGEGRRAAKGGKRRRQDASHRRGDQRFITLWPTRRVSESRTSGIRSGAYFSAYGGGPPFRDRKSRLSL